MKKPKKTYLLAIKERAGRKKNSAENEERKKKKTQGEKEVLLKVISSATDWQELYFVHKSSSSAENDQHRSEERAMGNEAGTLHAGEALVQERREECAAETLCSELRSEAKLLVSEANGTF
jgi:hypothetical protein